MRKKTKKESTAYFLILGSVFILLWEAFYNSWIFFNSSTADLKITLILTGVLIVLFLGISLVFTKKRTLSESASFMFFAFFLVGLWKILSLPSFTFVVEILFTPFAYLVFGTFIPRMIGVKR